MKKYFIIFCLVAFSAQAKTLSEVINLGLENSNQYQIEKHNLKAALNSKKSSISEFLPEISFNYERGSQQNIREDESVDDRFQTQQIQTLSVTQPIFQGFKGVQAVKQGDADYAAQQYAFVAFENELIFELISNYLEVSEYQKIIERAKANLWYYDQLLKSTIAKGKLTSDNEIIDYKINYYNALNQRENFANKLRQAESQYFRLTGQTATELPLLNEEPKNLILEDLLVKALSNPNIKQKYYELKSSKAAYKSEIGNLAPQINLSASHSKQDNAVFLDGEDLETKEITVNVTIPLFQKGSEYFAIKESKYNLEIKKQEYQLMIKEIEQQVKQYYAEYDYARKNYKSLRSINYLNYQKLEKSQKSFDLGLLDKIALNNAKINYGDAKINLAEAKIDYFKSYWQLKLLTEKYGQ